MKDDAPKLDDMLGVPRERLELMRDVLGMVRDELFPDADWKEFDRDMASHTQKIEARVQRAIDLGEPHE